jgi:hypothetical protein
MPWRRIKVHPERRGPAPSAPARLVRLVDLDAQPVGVQEPRRLLLPTVHATPQAVQPHGDLPLPAVVPRTGQARSTSSRRS